MILGNYTFAQLLMSQDETIIRFRIATLYVAFIERIHFEITTLYGTFKE